MLEVIAKTLEKLISFLWEKRRFVPYFIVFFVIAGVHVCLRFSDVRDFIYGPEWFYNYDEEEERVVFKTNSKLKYGQITVRFQYEFKYEDKVFYILEIQGIYNENQVNLCDNETVDLNYSGEIQEPKFCLTLEKRQREKVEKFEEKFRKRLEEYLKEHKGDFKAEELEMNEIQIAEISYQNLKKNKRRLMYVLVSDKEERTIIEEEVAIRGADASLNIDELNLDESFYTNEEIGEIIDDMEIK